MNGGMDGRMDGWMNGEILILVDSWIKGREKGVRREEGWMEGGSDGGDSK